MVGMSTWLRYIAYKFEYSISFSWKLYKAGKITEKEMGDAFWKNLLQGRMTFLHFNRGLEMVPTIGPQGNTLLVRRIPVADPTRVFIGDIVVVKDPEKTDNYLVRRLAATEGYEMASKDEKEEPFILDRNQCWVLSDNEALKPKEAKDSRSFGPVHMSDIIGRVIYCLRNAVDHSPVQNSRLSEMKDAPVLEVELDIEEMAKNHKASS